MLGASAAVRMAREGRREVKSRKRKSREEEEEKKWGGGVRRRNGKAGSGREEGGGVEEERVEEGKKKGMVEEGREWQGRGRRREWQGRERGKEWWGRGEESDGGEETSSSRPSSSCTVGVVHGAGTQWRVQPAGGVEDDAEADGIIRPVYHLVLPVVRDVSHQACDQAASPRPCPLQHDVHKPGSLGHKYDAVSRPAGACRMKQAQLGVDGACRISWPQSLQHAAAGHRRRCYERREVEAQE
eukprot:755587-Hanusia_phi.AAC.2